MMHHSRRVLHIFALLCVYLACLVMFGCKNSPDKQLTERNLYLKRWTSNTCVDTYHWSVELQNPPGQTSF